MKTTSTKTQIEKLKVVEESWFEIGNDCVSSFNKHSEIVSIRGGVAAHRCMMQSIRDQARYLVKKTK